MIERPSWRWKRNRFWVGCPFDQENEGNLGHFITSLPVSELEGKSWATANVWRQIGEGSSCNSVVFLVDKQLVSRHLLFIVLSFIRGGSMNEVLLLSFFLSARRPIESPEPRMTQMVQNGGMLQGGFAVQGRHSGQSGTYQQFLLHGSFFFLFFFWQANEIMY